MSDIVLVLGIMFFLVCSIRFSCNKKEVLFFSVEQTTALKGVAILLVYIHHFAQIRCAFYNNHTFLGFLGVSVFLFISGYATMVQAKKKQDGWKKNYWRKKIQRLIIPRVIVVFVFGYLAGRTLLQGLVESTFFWQDWFLAAIIFNYAVFYIALTKKKPVVKVLFICEAIFVVCCIASNQLIMWYNTAFMFAFGVLFAMHKEKVLEVISKLLYHRKLAVLLLIVLIFCSMMRYQRFIFDTLTGILFVMLVILYTYENSFFSKFYENVGRFSWEFYLVHSRIIGIVLNRFTNNNLLAFIESAIISLGIAVVLNKTLEAFYSLISKFKLSR